MASPCPPSPSSSPSSSYSSSASYAAAADADENVFERAERLKARGNDLFKRGEYRRANAVYSEIVDLVHLRGGGEPTSPLSADDDEMEKAVLAAAYCNRAAGWLQVGEWRNAVADCDEVLRLGQGGSLTVKALYRRGKAHEAFGDADSARRDFENALQLEPRNKPALEALENYKSVLHRLVVLSRATPEVRSRQRKGL